MSVLQILSSKLAGNSLQLSFLASGVVASSYFAYGNLGAVNFGLVPRILDPHAIDLPVATKVELWKWSYDRAKIHMAGATMTSAISFFAAAVLASSHSVKHLLLGAAAMSFAVGPWTLIAMMPVNNELFAMHNGKTLQASASDEKAPIDKRAIEHLNRWRELHRVRLALGVGAWFAGIVALVVSV